MKKGAQKAMCRKSTEENNNWYKSMKANKADLKEIKEKAEDWLTELKICSNGMFRLAKTLKIDN